MFQAEHWKREVQWKSQRATKKSKSEEPAVRQTVGIPSETRSSEVTVYMYCDRKCCGQVRPDRPIKETAGGQKPRMLQLKKATGNIMKVERGQCGGFKEADTS